MIFTLLPFFLAANVTVNEIEWKHGPEMIYNAQVNATSNSSDTGTEIYMYNMTIKLKCRPKSDQILSCHFNDPKSTLTILENNDNVLDMKKSGEIVDNHIGRDIFELKFDTDGIDSIVISSTISPVKLDMIRALALQFNVGADFNIKNNIKKSFDEIEYSAAGECKTSYALGINEFDKSYDNNDKEIPYELMVLPDFISSSGKIVRIYKRRHIDDCPFDVHYFFGSREAYRKDFTYDTRLVTSTSHIKITKNGFISFTENYLQITNNKFQTNIDLRERLAVALDKIVPATGLLPIIEDPVTASIIPTQSFGIDSSEEYQSGSNEFVRRFTS